MLTARTEHLSDSVVLYLGDCRDVLPMIKRADVVVTDPPYGVQLGKNGPTAIGKVAYASFEDTAEYVRAVCVPVIETCIKRFGRVVMTPGSRNAFAYPMPDEIGTIYNPAGAGFSRWGIRTSQPILYYGKDPRGVEKMPQSLQSTETVEKNGHPCPKPFKLMRWLVNRASMPGETVVDPFMGSGTTGVAAVMLGRKFIGIEFEPAYYEIARARIVDALARPDLFITQPARAAPLELQLNATGRP